MTAATVTAPERSGVGRLDRRSWKVPIAFGLVTLAALVLFVILGRDRIVSFNLSTGTDLIQLPLLAFPALAGGIVVTVVLAVVTAFAVFRVWERRPVPLWVIVIGTVVAIVGFLAWAGAGATLQVPGLLTGTLFLATPLVYGALAGVIGERGGVVNIAIEAQLLGGAFTSAVVASLTQQPFVGLAAAGLAGMLVAFLLAAFAIKYFVEQVIVGVVINVLVSGLTGFLYSQVLTENRQLLNSPVRFDRIDIPLLSQIPVIGPTLFRQTILVYLMYVIVAVVAFALYRTKWGLRLRAVGEHPKAADTVGINVARTRFWNVALAGVIAGFGGAFFTLGSNGAFNKDMTNGAGFIALAAVIFGGWDPVRATLAALLFGFASNLQNALSVIGSPVPSEFMLMLPYVVTIAAVAGLVGRSRAPAADGVPYIKS
ncbi:MAG: ABC transporter permease [Actinomycetales bacterium]|nr:ABC transporter permease [Actinomycetales bacterium]